MGEKSTAALQQVKPPSQRVDVASQPGKAGIHAAGSFTTAFLRHPTPHLATNHACSHLLLAVEYGRRLNERHFELCLQYVYLVLGKPRPNQVWGGCHYKSADVTTVYRVVRGGGSVIEGGNPLGVF